MLITSRGPNRDSSRPSPSLRFRRTKYQEKLAYKETKKSKKPSSGVFFGPFTFPGFALFVFLALIIVGLLWFFVFSPTFLVKKVEIASATTLTPEQIQNAFDYLQKSRKFLFVPENHIVLLNESRIAEALRKFYPGVEQVYGLKRVWPNHITFSIIEKKPLFLIKGEGGYRYLLDKDGLVLGEVGTILPDNLIVLEGDFEGRLVAGEHVGSEEMLVYIREMHEQWYEEWPFKPVSYRLNLGQIAEITVVLNEDWFIKADADDDPSAVLLALKLLLDSELNTAQLRAQLAYIDLRLSTRAFYCLKGQRCAEVTP